MQVRVFRDEEDGPSGSTCLTFLYQDADGAFYQAEPVVLTFSKMAQGARIRPTLSLRGQDAGSLLKALAEDFVALGALPQRPQEARLAGELEATKKHLEDVRALVRMQGGRVLA